MDEGMQERWDIVVEYVRKAGGQLATIDGEAILAANAEMMQLRKTIELLWLRLKRDRASADARQRQAATLTDAEIGLD